MHHEHGSAALGHRRHESAETADIQQFEAALKHLLARVHQNPSSQFTGIL
ncbi:TenA family transcription regulator [Roseibium sp. TrichSKD4]|nr:TenA family transcription regulator [Roseibium sp. TrichSKD4]